VAELRSRAAARASRGREVVREVQGIGLAFYRAERGREGGGRGGGRRCSCGPPLMVVARWEHRCAGGFGKGRRQGGAWDCAAHSRAPSGR
jgi:hypothetical protein